MITLIVIIHVITCILLIGIILIQAGRGGGLVEGFTGVESMFGTKTNAFLSRATTIFATIFFLSCCSLAVLSARQGKSLMTNVKPNTVAQTVGSSPETTSAQAPAQQETPKQEESKTEAPSTE